MPSLRHAGRRSRTGFLFLALLPLTLIACGPSPGDTTPVLIGPSDAAVEPTDTGTPSGPLDAGVDAEPDVIEEDAGADTPPEDAGIDAAPDTGTPLTCTSPNPCIVSTAYLGQCVESTQPDGTLCGDGSFDICLAGTCITRGCGDGYLEPGPFPAAEACDDGNTTDGDGCSSLCEPETILLGEGRAPVDALDEGAEVLLSGAAGGIAVDGTGAALLTYGVNDVDTGLSFYARRFTAGLAALDPIDAPLYFDTTSRDSARPSSCGLRAGGFLVAIETGPRVLKVFHVRANGAVSSYQLAADAGATAPRMACLYDGAVVVWTDALKVANDNYDRVRAQRFDNQGSPVTAAFTVSTLPVSGGRLEAHVSSWYDAGHAFAGTDAAPNTTASPYFDEHKNLWAVSWQQLPRRTIPATGDTAIAVRRFNLGAAIDTVELAVYDLASAPSLRFLESGDALIATSSSSRVIWQALPLDPLVPLPNPVLINPFAGANDGVQTAPLFAALSGPHALFSFEEQEHTREVSGGVHVMTVGFSPDGTPAPFDWAAHTDEPRWLDLTGTLLRPDVRDLTAARAPHGLWLSYTAVSAQARNAHAVFVPLASR